MSAKIRSGPELVNYLADRSQPEPNSGCLLWLGPINLGGYGHFHRKRNGKGTLAHRASWALRYGELGSSMMVLHKCDTPTCINPDHLFLGTQADNMKDRSAKMRQPHGEGHPAAKITEDDVREIRRLKPTTCHRELIEQFGISKRAIQFIVSRKNWKHVK